MPWRLALRRLCATLPLLISTASFCLGCGPDVRYVDPEVDYGDEPAYAPAGEPELELGFYEDKLYVSLADGDDVQIVEGSQGGSWVMLAVRTQGMTEEVSLEAELETAQEKIGQVRVDQRFVLAADGWLELRILPIPIQHAAPRQGEEIDDLFGAQAELSLQVRDRDGRELESQMEVTLVQG